LSGRGPEEAAHFLTPAVSLRKRKSKTRTTTPPSQFQAGRILGVGSLHCAQIGSSQRQGQRLGHHLLGYVEEKARKANLRELRLLTNQAFEANIRLYAPVGLHERLLDRLHDASDAQTEAIRGQTTPQWES
jgi:ribosomal protein S18 acetylase RimI-like enzyme